MNHSSFYTWFEAWLCGAESLKFTFPEDHTECLMWIHILLDVSAHKAVFVLKET